MLADYALTDEGQGGLGLLRVEAKVEPDNQAPCGWPPAAGCAARGCAGSSRASATAPRRPSYVVLARLASDPPLTEPEAFRALLNSFLPRKRAIGQMLVRDPGGRVLLCQLTYKRDWDLPGGVVEVGESPRLAVGREVEEELGLSIKAGDLLLTDWLPPWGGWDDAVCLVFDGGVHDAAILDDVVTADPRDLVGRVLRPRAGARALRRLHGAPDRGRARAASTRAARRTPSPAADPSPGADVRPLALTRAKRGRIREMSTYVYDFAQGNKDQKDLLGGKGANLAEMTNLGLPVPPGFTISTEACRAYLEDGPRARRAGRRGRRAPARRSRRRWDAGSATPTTRCWSRCARERSSRCPG